MYSFASIGHAFTYFVVILFYFIIGRVPAMVIYQKGFICEWEATLDSLQNWLESKSRFWCACTLLIIILLEKNCLISWHPL